MSGASGFHPLRVAAVDRLTDDAVAVTFEVPERLRDAFAFRAGQHVTLRRDVGGQDVRRTYSLCTSAVDGPLRVAIKALPAGVLSSWACQELRAGDSVEVGPPSGAFGPVLPGTSRRYGLVGAGSGITPLLSIATTVLAVEPDSEVALILGNRTSRDVMLLDDLADLKDRHPQRLQVLHVLSREEQAAPLLSGRLDGDRLRQVLDALLPPETVDAWYLCGPFGVVTGARDTLLALGVPATDVHVELFHADAPPPRPAVEHRSTGTAVTATLHGRTSELICPPGQVVLDAVLAVRADAPFACRGGVCGTCRAHVDHGAVQMDVNWALEPDELAAGVVLTCQARPVTEALGLTFL